MRNFFTSFFLGLALLITLSESKAQLYNQDFSEAGDSSLVGWTSSVITGTSGDKWRYNNPGNRLINYPITGKCAIFDSEATSNDGVAEKVILTSPAFDASNSQNIIFIFDHYFVEGNGGKGSIEVSGNNGSTWNQVAVYTTTTPNPKREAINISAYISGSSTARIRFIWEGNTSKFWAIDNIRVFAPLNLDASVTGFDSPVFPISGGNHIFKISFTNFGENTLSSLVLNWSVDGVLQTPKNWSGTLPIGNSVSNFTLGTL